MLHEPEFIREADFKNATYTTHWWRLFEIFYSKNQSAIEDLRTKVMRNWSKTVDEQIQIMLETLELPPSYASMDHLQPLPMMLIVADWPLSHEKHLVGDEIAKAAFAAVLGEIDDWLNKIKLDIALHAGMRACTLSAIAFWLDYGVDTPFEKMAYVPNYQPDGILSQQQRRDLAKHFLLRLVNKVGYYPEHKSRLWATINIESTIAKSFTKPYLDYIDTVYQRLGFTQSKGQRKSKFDRMSDTVEWLYLKKVEGKSHREIANIELAKHEGEKVEGYQKTLKEKYKQASQDAKILRKASQTFEEASNELKMIMERLKQQSPTLRDFDILSEFDTLELDTILITDRASEARAAAEESQRKADYYADAMNGKKLRPDESTVGNTIRDLCILMGIND